MANGNALVHCSAEFDPLATTLGFTVSASVFEVGGVAPTDIIHTDQAWYVEVTLELTGSLIRHLGGQWLVAVVLESVGPGTDYQFPTPSKAVPVDPCGNGKYTIRIDVPAGEVEGAAPEGSLYLIGVKIGSLDLCQQSGHLHAHCRGGDLHFVPPHHP
jgi:hypothetical protein